MYLAQTYHDYFEEKNADLYGSKRVHVPKPELYMIFTGERADRLETISLSEEFFGGKECAIEVKVKVVYGGKENDIISQYVDFTKVYNEQVKLHGRRREAVTETMRICKERDVLREFLAGRDKEVISIMMSLFDDERIMRTHIASEKKEAAKETAGKMLKMGRLSVEDFDKNMSGHLQSQGMSDKIENRNQEKNKRCTTLCWCKQHEAREVSLLPHNTVFPCVLRGVLRCLPETGKFFFILNSTNG